MHESSSASRTNVDQILKDRSSPQSCQRKNINIKMRDYYCEIYRNNHRKATAKFVNKIVNFYDSYSLLAYCGPLSHKITSVVTVELVVSGRLNSR